MINSRQNQDKVLKEFLRLCGVYGWNDKVLQDAVLKAGFTEGDEFFIFSGGVDGLIKFLVDKGNKEFEQKSQGKWMKWRRPRSHGLTTRSRNA